jgi:magnesium transporter
MEITELKEEIQKNLSALDHAVGKNQLFTIKSLINELPAQDAADYLEEQSDDEAKATLFRLLHKDLAVDVFEHLEFEEQEILLSSLKKEKVGEILEQMDPDDRTDLLEEMPAKVVKEYLRLLSPEERNTASRLLGYPVYSVGRLMTTGYVSMRPETTIRQAVDKLKESAPDKETIYHCYIVDNTRRLIGYCSLKMIFMAEWEQTLGEIMQPEVISLQANTDQEVAANLFKHYDLLALPVVDSERRLLGIVTFDDLVDVIEEENTEDIQKMAAIVPEELPYFDQSMHSMAAKRILWLSVLLVAQLFSTLVLSRYENSLQHAVTLAMFIPMLMATGGNTGAQSSMMVIRGLAMGEIRMKHLMTVLLREMSTGLMLGAGLCVLGIGSSYLVAGELTISLVLGIAITLTVIAAAVIGGGLPMVLRAMKLDPALMSGPFITTLVDIIGLFIYFETYKILAG